MAHYSWKTDLPREKIIEMVEGGRLVESKLRAQLAEATGLLVECVSHLPLALDNRVVEFVEASRAPAQAAHQCAAGNACQRRDPFLEPAQEAEPKPDFPSTIRKAKEWQARAESAESKLAAVREALQMPEYYATNDPDDLLGSEIAEMQSCLRDAWALLAPSQGEGGGG